MPAVRRLALLLALALGLVCLSTGVALTSVAPAQAGIDVDSRLSRGECALTGRLYVGDRGCARHRCVPGSRIFKEGLDAELCRVAGHGGAEYASPISERRCLRLHRVWLGEINSCASNPRRWRAVVAHAPQCTGRTTTYVTQREVEGYYDECVRPGRLRKLVSAAARQRVSLNRAVLERSRANCSFRGGWVMVDDRCVVRAGPPPVEDLGGMLMVGDSVSWRADDELNARKARWTFDLRPGRRLDELLGRLDWYRADHGDPDELIVQLGTNRRSGFGEDKFRAVLATVPARVPVLFLLPFRASSGDNEALVHATRKYAGWMRTLAAQRPGTCVADWPSFAARHLDHLVDGEHPASNHEDWYARYAIHAWAACESELGRTDTP